MPKVTIQTDAQKELLDDLTALRQTFLDAGVTITRPQVAGWLAGIDAVTDLVKWRAYEKKASLLLIECLMAITRRLAL